jgi:hypothetical protein
MALTTNTQTQAAGVLNYATGYVVTDAAAAVNTTFVVGFTPRSIRVYNVTDGISDEWFAGMANGSALHTVAAGTRTLAASPTGITVGTAAGGDAGSFTIPAALIPASKTLIWEAQG